jgi:hypothetical protein
MSVKDSCYKRALSAIDSPQIALVQLPFPSQSDPLPILSRYYEAYVEEYQKIFPEYKLQEGDLWEAPLWVAHLDGAIGRPDTIFIDLSKEPFQAGACIEKIHQEVSNLYLIFMSPLAQNLSLASEISRELIKDGYRTVVGGNMVELVSLEDFSIVYTGIARTGVYEEILSQCSTRLGSKPFLGRNQKRLGYRPRYRLLSTFGERVPLVRLNASHGCLFGCTFCGDAWTKQLHLVELEHLQAEVDEIREVFPITKLIYIGDKTFGQSREAVENLGKVISPQFGFRLIAQTHVTMISPWLLDAMEALGVEVVEIGFETANSTILSELKKLGGEERFMRAFQKLNNRGFHVILNVIGGLPNETHESQQQTLHFLEMTSGLVWLHNLYNFVPYPKTPIFPTIRDRIVDWNFQNWREDKPVVFTPYHQTREEAWEYFLRLVDSATTLIVNKKLLEMAVVDH